MRMLDQALPERGREHGYGEAEGDGEHERPVSAMAAEDLPEDRKPRGAHAAPLSARAGGWAQARHAGISAATIPAAMPIAPPATALQADSVNETFWEGMVRSRSSSAPAAKATPPTAATPTITPASIKASPSNDRRDAPTALRKAMSRSCSRFRV